MHILFAKGFSKNHKHLQPGVRRHCNERLLLFEINPFHPLLENHTLHGTYEGCRSINITGDYRAIFYYETPEIVRFITVGTHHELFGT